MGRKLPAISFFFLFFFIGSCRSGGTASVIGKWSFDEVDAKYAQSYHLTPEEVKSLPEKSSMEFTKKGLFKSVMPHESTGGVYYIKGSNQLTTIFDDGRVIDYSIDLLETNHMVLSCEWGRLVLKRTE